MTKTRLVQILRNRKISVLLIIIAIVALAVVVSFARSSKPAQAGPPVLEVGVVQVEQRNVPIYSEWIGTTEGMVNAELKAQVTGYLLRQDYKEGSFVKKGQLLFEIDPAQFQGQLEQSKSQITQAEAQLAQAQSGLLQAQARLAQAQANQVKAELDVKKYQPLAEQKAVTQQDLDNALQANTAAKAQVDAEKAGVEAARAQLAHASAQIGVARAGVATAKGQLENAQAAARTAALNLSFTRIVSPIDGIAGMAQAQVGDLVSTTSNPLTTVSTLDPIKVYFTLSEQDYLRYTKPFLSSAEQNGSLEQLELELVLSDGTTYPEKGRFYFADRQVDPKTGAIRMAGVFPNPNNGLRPGQYGRVRAVTSTQENALMVPQRAVSELQGTYQVAVVGQDNKVSFRTVKVGERSGSMWVITDGLQAGETVVAEGTMKVRPGMQVKPVAYVATNN
jgi:membrane fusion protein (multidrug efflux system)